MATARSPGHQIPAQSTHQAVRPAGTPDAADPGRALDIIAGVPTDYHRFAGSSLDRLAALSDGILAVVMTLLVLDLRVPVVDGLHTEAALWHELGKLTPRLLTYFLSFLTLGIFWVGQQTQLNQLARSDRNLTWIHLGFLLGVSLMPFSTGLLAEFITYRLALVVYWLNLLLLGAVLFTSLGYAERSGLMKDDTTAEMLAAGRRRIVVYQALYAVCLLVGVVSTYAGITLLVLLQLNSAIAPRIRPLDRF